MWKSVPGLSADEAVRVAEIFVFTWPMWMTNFRRMRVQFEKGSYRRRRLTLEHWSGATNPFDGLMKSCKLIEIVRCCRVGSRFECRQGSIAWWIGFVDD